MQKHPSSWAYKGWGEMLQPFLKYLSTLSGMGAREEFHFYLGLVTGLCQHQDRDEKLLQLMLEQLEGRRMGLECMLSVSGEAQNTAHMN